MGQVFVSYSHTDADYVARLKNHLARAGLDVWTDEGIESGARWSRTIEEKVRACSAFIPVMSPNSRDSEWVMNEILAAQNLRKPIMPLLLAGEPFLELLSIQYEDVRGGHLPKDAYIERLQRVAGRVSAERSSAASVAVQPAPPPPAASVSRQTDGRVVAWGRYTAAQRRGIVDSLTRILGEKPQPLSPVHEAVPAGLTDVTAVAAGCDHGLALQRDGRVIAWGALWSFTSRWGSAGVVEASVPSGISDVTAIAAGGSRTLALHSNGCVTAWGIGAEGGDEIAPASLEDVIAIAAGPYHSLALHSDGRVTTWGERWYDQTKATVPAGFTDVIAIAAGESVSLALHSDGHVTAWAIDGVEASVPEGLTDVIAIATGGYQSLALHSDGRVTGWGTGPGARVPVWLDRVTAIAAGDRHCLVIHRDGHVAAWGDNDAGQTTVPAGLTDVTAIAAGGCQSLAIVGA